VLIATLTLPHEGVALERAFRERPEMRVEAERVAAHSTDWVMPCLWISSSDFEAVTEALAADPDVDDIVQTYEFDDEKYYQIEWTDGVSRRINTFLDKEGSMLEASATADGWRLRIRFASRDQFQTFRDYFRARSYSFDLLSMTEPGTPRQMATEVTPDQRDALALAVERGYYEVPRETTLRDLADELGTSHQAVSELLRRGVTNLVRSTVVTGEGAGS